MIPERFKERMKPYLGDDFERFIEALESSSAVRALRLNPIKYSEKEAENFGITTQQIDYIDGGFFFDEEKIGDNPFHHGGAFYCQDPSAMCTVAAAEEYLRPDMTALDTCSAPGGKSTQLAAYIPDGILYFNEINRQRAQILRSNAERLGVKNAVITSLDTSVYAKNFEAAFDVVLCDAPCSGEGMFRKYDEAVTEWSEENIELCAKRQAEILDNAAKSVKGGGILIYSTCTYAPEEDEMTVDAFLERHGEFSLVPVSEKIKAVTRGPLPLPDLSHDLSECRRFYPHVSRGEGQFFCIMKKDADAPHATLPTLKKSPARSLTRDEEKIALDFLNSNLSEIPEGYSLSMLGNTVMLAPAGAVCPDGTLCFGIAAGEITKGRFEPHHHLFSSLGKSFKRKAYLSDTEAATYLRGETLPTDSENGYCAVIFNGVVLGGGKAVGGTLKNHYPKGLRSRR